MNRAPRYQHYSQPELFAETAPQPELFEQAPITYFRGENWYLSSMYPLRNGVETRDGVVVDSVEIGYQAEKFAHSNALRNRVLAAPDGFRAKKIAKIIEVGEGISPREDWPERKVAVMKWYVWQKFGRNQREAEQLMATGDRKIVEGNNRGDDFWGVIMAPGREPYGENRLGILLMKARTLLQEGVDLVGDAHTDAFDENVL